MMGVWIGLAACISILLYKTYGFGIPFASYEALTLFLTAAAVKDFKSRIIPDKLLAVMALAGVVFMFWNPDMIYLNAILAALFAGGILTLVSFVTKGSLGLGDAKLFACMGIYLGLEKTMASMVLAAVFAGVFGVVLMIKDTANRKRAIPFAPFILAGTAVALLV